MSSFCAARRRSFLGGCAVAPHAPKGTAGGRGETPAHHSGLECLAAAEELASRTRRWRSPTTTRRVNFVHRELCSMARPSPVSAEGTLLPENHLVESSVTKPVKGSRWAFTTAADDRNGGRIAS